MNAAPYLIRPALPEDAAGIAQLLHDIGWFKAYEGRSIAQNTEAIQSLLVAIFGQGIVFLIGLKVSLMGHQLDPIGLAAHQGVGHLAKGGLDRLFVVGDGDVLGGLGAVEHMLHET